MYFIVFYSRTPLVSSILGLAGFGLGAANTETNAKENSQNRAVMEGGDLNDWFNTVDIAGRLHVRAASFCMAQGDHYDDVGFHLGCGIQGGSRLLTIQIQIIHVFLHVKRVFDCILLTDPPYLAS